MNARLKTTNELETKLSELQNWLHFSSKAAIMRLAISYSLANKSITHSDEINEWKYDIKNQDGADYLRWTILGQYDELYQLLIANDMKEAISDERFFPELIYFHINRGVILLHSEYRFVNNRDKFFQKLMSNCD
jgi:DNA sulfur modification protein DndE